MSNEMIIGVLGGVGVSILVFILGLVSTGFKRAGKTTGEEINKLLDGVPKEARVKLKENLVLFLDGIEEELCGNRNVKGDFTLVSNTDVREVISESKTRIDLGVNWKEKEGVGAEVKGTFYP